MNEWMNEYESQVAEFYKTYAGVANAGFFLGSGLSSEDGNLRFNEVLWLVGVALFVVDIYSE